MDSQPLENGNVTVTSNIVGGLAVYYICDNSYRFSTSDTP